MNKNELICDKKEFVMVDYCKFIFCFLVIYIHIPAFANINPDISFWIKETLARIAVPYFFMSTGFFLGNGIKDKARVFSYLKKIIVMYLLYSIIYLPQIIYALIEENYSLMNGILKLLKDFLFVGTYIQLWYLLAIIFSVYLLYVLLNVFKVKKEYIVVFAISMYLIGVIGSVFKESLKELPLLSYYFRIFSTTRNGLFFGLLFVLIGYLIRTSNLKVMWFTYLKLFLISLLFMNIEVYYYMNSLYAINGFNMTLMLPIVCSCFFLMTVSIKLENSNKKFPLLCRKLSILIYGLHLFISFYSAGIMKYSFGIVYDELILYMITSILSLCISYVVIIFSQKERFKYLKKLYS